jgi:hypothetical protein
MGARSRCPADRPWRLRRSGKPAAESCAAREYPFGLARGRLSAGGALVYAVTCLIAPYMRGHGASTLRATAGAQFIFTLTGYNLARLPKLLAA